MELTGNGASHNSSVRPVRGLPLKTQPTAAKHDSTIVFEVALVIFLQG